MFRKEGHVKVFIVGATGVIGRALVPMLLELGDEVVALVRSLERARAIAEPRVSLVEGDLLEIEPGALAKLLRGCDVVAHMATALRPGSPGLGKTNTNAALRTTGTRKLLDACLEAGAGRLVQQSITMAYVDGGDDWLDENTPFFQAEGGNPMSQPVIEMEAMIRAIDPATLGWVILRGSSFVGEQTRQDQHIAGLKAGELKVAGDGSQWVSYVHFEDYAAAVAAAIHSPLRGRVFNVTDDPIREGEYYDRLAELLSLAAPERDPSMPGPRSHRCTNAAAKEALRWEPKRGIWPWP
jgi:nucleoside-diphosphate-sugar epimerase